MGKAERRWQNVDYVLKLFERSHSRAIRRYREFVKEGIADGRRTDLVGGGLTSSAGGWSALRTLRRQPFRMKEDERILGDGRFVEKVLRRAGKNLERRYAIKAQKYDFNWLVRQVAEALDMQPDDVLAPGRYKNAVKARSVLCYWGTRELGLTTVELAKRLHLSQPTVSQSAMRGRKIALEEGLRLNMVPQWFINGPHFLRFFYTKFFS